MKRAVKSELGKIEFIIGLSVFLLFFCLSQLFMSYAHILLFSLAIAFIALFTTLDGTSFKASFIFSSAVIIVFSFFFSKEMLIFNLGALLLGLIASLCYTKGVNKAETALYMVFAGSFTVLLFVYLYFAGKSGSYSFDAVRDNYFNFTEWLKSYLADNINKMTLLQYEAGAIGEEMFFMVEPKDFTPLFNRAVSIVVLGVFTLVGFALKLYRRLLLSLSLPTAHLVFWRFKLKAMYAYVFLALFFCSFFLKEDNILDICVINILNVFDFVFSYIGLSFTFSVISGKYNKFIAVIFTVILLSLISSFAPDLLPLIGAVVTIIISKFSKNAHFSYQFEDKTGNSE